MRALIFCAGEGRRLRPLTLTTPKPLIAVGPHELVVHQILALKKAGITEFVLNVAHLATQMMQALGDGARYGVKIQWSVEGENVQQALETRGGIVKALPLLLDADNDRFLAVAGDIITDYDYTELVQTAQQMSPHTLGHLVLVPNPAYHQEGDMGLSADHLVTLNTPTTYTYSCLSAFKGSLFSGLSCERQPLFPWLYEAVKREQITGELFTGYWANVGTPQELELAQQHWARNEDRSI